MGNYHQLLGKLKKLSLPQNQYAIYGAGPMAIRNIRETKDIDIVAKDELYKKLKKKYGEKEPCEINIGDISVFSLKNSLIDNASKIIDRADEIDGHKFIHLDDLIKWKKKMGRRKDLKDIELIKKYLK